MVKKLASGITLSAGHMKVAWLALTGQPTGGHVRFASLLLIDLAVALFALYGALSLSASRQPVPADFGEFVALGALMLATAGSFVALGLYRSLIRHMGQQAVWALARAVTLTTGSLVALVYFADIDMSVSIPIVFWLILFVGTGAIRMVMRT